MSDYLTAQLVYGVVLTEEDFAPLAEQYGVSFDGPDVVAETVLEDVCQSTGASYTIAGNTCADETLYLLIAKVPSISDGPVCTLESSDVEGVEELQKARALLNIGDDRPNQLHALALLT